jgi:hypothetical protein
VMRLEGLLVAGAFCRYRSSEGKSLQAASRLSHNPEHIAPRFRSIWFKPDL